MIMTNGSVGTVYTSQDEKRDARERERQEASRCLDFMIKFLKGDLVMRERDLEGALHAYDGSPQASFNLALRRGCVITVRELITEAYRRAGVKP